MRFWLGLIIGLIIGANIGFFVAALMSNSKIKENEENMHIKKKEKEDS